MENLKTGKNFYRVFLLFLAGILNSNLHLDGMLPWPCPAAGEASGGNPSGIRGMWAGREGERDPTVHRCALPWTCSAIQSQHHKSQRLSCWGTGYSHPQVPSWCQCGVQGETVTFRWVEASNGFEQHLKERGNFFPITSWLKIVFFPLQHNTRPQCTKELCTKGVWLDLFTCIPAHTQRGNSLSDHFSLFST